MAVSLTRQSIVYVNQNKPALWNINLSNVDLLTSPELEWRKKALLIKKRAGKMSRDATGVNGEGRWERAIQSPRRAGQRETFSFCCLR